MNANVCKLSNFTLSHQVLICRCLDTSTSTSTQLRPLNAFEMMAILLGDQIHCHAFETKPVQNVNCHAQTDGH